MTGALEHEDRDPGTAWAREVGGYIVEDDYDAEYRYDRRPVGALRGLAPDRVIYCGTTSKTLASGVRLGWMVVPPPLIEPMVARRHLTDGSTATVLQATFAAFLDSGDLDRHLRHTRRVYRERRDAVLAALGRWMPDATPMGVSAGQNVLVMLPAGADEEAVVRRALEVGVRVYPLAGFLWTADENRRTRRVHSDPPSAGVGEAAGRGRPGLILGYGSVPADRALYGIRQLSRCIADR